MLFACNWLHWITALFCYIEIRRKHKRANSPQSGVAAKIRSVKSRAAGLQRRSENSGKELPDWRALPSVIGVTNLVSRPVLIVQL